MSRLGTWNLGIFADETGTNLREQGIAWKAVSTFDVIIEICLIVLSVVLVWGIQMRRKEKAKVIFAFATRISYVASPFWPSTELTALYLLAG